MTPDHNSQLRRAMATVALLNLGYFGIEFAVALAIASVSLFADSIDFLEDASLNSLALLALGWSVTARSRVGILLAVILLVPSAATAWTAFDQFFHPTMRAAVPLTLAGTGALVVNVVCATILARYKSVGGSLTRAVYLSARNDAFANVAIIVAGGLTITTQSHWPDLLVGVGIFLLNLDAAFEVMEEARKERQSGGGPTPA